MADKPMQKEVRIIEDDLPLDQLALTQFLRMNAVVTGVIFGLMAGAVIFVATNWLVLRGGPVVGPHLTLVNQFFIGYEVTFKGSLIGFAYSFMSGFVVGSFLAWIYNWLLDLRDGKDARRAA
jgi:hypothetical protein